MCYDIRTKLESMLKRARFRNDEQRIRELLDKLEPYLQDDLFHASGFQHPWLLVYPQHEPDLPILCRWGLIPNWVKDDETLQRIQNQTLNARGETIFEKSSFRHSARMKRCLIYVDGFFEHHEFNGKKYPFHIARKDGEPMILGGLWSEWTDRDTGEVLKTCSIVTTEANPMMAQIHNNPKLPEPRMPVILPEEQADDWLIDWRGDLETAKLMDLMHPYPQEELTAYPVQRLRGKEALGNVPQAIEEFHYPELELELTT
ncbi:MAG: SOS response-associated peptidase [Flavobacteriales bacterium]|nr:SOS response-associated peptidase [Flavobacteriales bacterium]